MATKKDIVTLTVKRPDEALFKQSTYLLDLAEDYEISTPELAVAAADDLKAVKALAKQLEQKRTAITGPINQALREVNALFKPAKEWLSQAEQLLKGKLLAYQNEQDRIARELQAEADALAKKEQEKLDRRAAKAEAKGKAEKAEALRRVAETTTAPVIESAAPKLSGIATRETWKAEVTDKALLLKHIVNERPDLLPLVEINQSALNAQARSLKNELDLPGVEVKKETSLAASAH